MDNLAQFEEQRPALTGHCYRMLGSVVEADDAVQETSFLDTATLFPRFGLPPRLPA